MRGEEEMRKGRASERRAIDMFREKRRKKKKPGGECVWQNAINPVFSPRLSRVVVLTVHRGGVEDELQERSVVQRLHLLGGPVVAHLAQGPSRRRRHRRDGLMGRGADEQPPVEQKTEGGRGGGGGGGRYVGGDRVRSRDAEARGGG